MSLESFAHCKIGLFALLLPSSDLCLMYMNMSTYVCDDGGGVWWSGVRQHGIVETWGCGSKNQFYNVLVL